MTTQPEALRLADALLNQVETNVEWGQGQVDSAAAELRRLHEVNQELLEALKEVYDNLIHSDDVCEATTKVRAAINKAERTTT